MFVQVFQGPVSDRARARALMDQWVEEHAPAAEGWLGSTTGVTEDGMLVALARFDSEEAAQRNSNRPEQGEWWSQVETLFTSEPEFRNSTAVDVDTYGDPARAGFVQVMQGRTSDPERSRELMAGDPIDWQTFRPDILGSVLAHHADGEWTMALYFTSEAEAREGEKKEPPPELEAMMEEMDALSVGEPRFYDLKDPWMAGPQ
jgi:hypothetical protein